MDTKESAIDCKQVYELVAIGHCVVCDVHFEPGATIKTTDVDRRNYLVETGFAKEAIADEVFDDTPVVPVTPAPMEEDSEAPAETKSRFTRNRR